MYAWCLVRLLFFLACQNLGCSSEATTTKAGATTETFEKITAQTVTIIVVTPPPKTELTTDENTRPVTVFTPQPVCVVCCVLCVCVRCD